MIPQKTMRKAQSLADKLNLPVLIKGSRIFPVIENPKIGKIGETYLIDEAPYESHRRGKNWAAYISGLDPKYKYTRKFLKKGGEHGQYILEVKPIAGEIFEIRAIYHSGGGSPSPSKDSGFYELASDGTLTQVSESKVKEKFSQKLTETF